MTKVVEFLQENPVQFMAVCYWFSISAMGVGELLNFMASCFYMLPTVLIYRKWKNKKSAIAGLVIGTLISSIAMAFANLFVAFPLYGTLYWMSMETIVDMCTAVNPMIHDTVTMLMFSILPFNILKFGTVSLITFFVYKRISSIVHHIIE